jgi:hypothetical protein
MESPVGGRLTTTEHIFYFYTVGRLLQQGPFYQSDLSVAVTLGASESAIRKARRKLGWHTGKPRIVVANQEWHVSVERSQQGIGWFAYTPGWRNEKRSIATKYLSVIPSGESPEKAPPARIPWFTFQVLLGKVRAGILRHPDILVWLVLATAHEQHQREEEAEAEQPFVVERTDIIEETRLSDVSKSLMRLQQQLTDQGEELFKVMGREQRLVVCDWREFPDPMNDANSARRQQEMEFEIAAKVVAMKAAAAAKHNRSGNISHLGGKDHPAEDPGY